MAIIYNESSKTFHLECKNTSYIIGVYDNKFLMHLYYGKKVSSLHPERMEALRELGFAPSPNEYFKQRYVSLDTMRQEFPSFGYGDFRSPAVMIEQKNGSRITDFRYVGYELCEKIKIKGMPSLNPDDNCDTLKIILLDDVTNVEADLYYNVYGNLDIITKHVVLINKGKDDVTINKLASMSMDISDYNYNLLDLYGTHCKERHMEFSPLHHGITKIESRRTSSSHMMNPFFALCRKDCTEYQGECLGVNLVYSGNFEGTIEVDQRDTTRIQMGIGSFDFAWNLKVNESFYSPEVVMCYSISGLNNMSLNFHHLYNTCLLKRHYYHPIVCNNWEATYFNFNEEKLEKIIDSASGLGIETFVLDDGWFGHRDNDESSLGDWKVNLNKLPHGLKHISDYCKSKNMSFGLWFEPEMISIDSDLYRAHPDYAIKVDDRLPLHSRCQMVLDLSKKEVCDYIIKAMSDVIDNVDISYIKWDFNRNITETSSKELSHRYVLGLYYVLETITSKYPRIMIEGCSGGGGRFDPAMLYYTPQIWTSDDSDAIERLFIQYGTSICYPPTTMVGHVSITPNHQTGRVTPIKTRGLVAMSCNFGYELNPQVLSKEERKIVKEQTKFYGKFKKVLYNSDFYRLRSPFFGAKDAAWSFVSYNKNHVYAMYVRILNGATNRLDWLKFKGLDPNKYYQDVETKEIYTGSELMEIGILLPRHPYDFHSCLYEFKVVRHA